ncbi:hypothetical protein B5566_18685 [Mycobacterium sp. MHSD3]|uniref:hypothetical protein n=1 Tax=Mycobacteroides chelonae TaxID=1774 RepID=UPI0009D30857|nr:hypothetical protein [Mycobacteroides chelonae]MBF9520373.1 hypothetical protein [Mycobacteroides chelonae]PKQ56397.1 hypothetical protein B5566_18685 [Mycobacterium sp. MHSD3]SKM19384.1 Uncharacterised protein [Mycobacteroides abscessus subsp. bolletii]
MTSDQETTKPEPKPKAPSEHMVFRLTLLAIGFVALRILIVSRGDSDTLRALVQNLNVTAIVLATILPLVTTAVVLAFVLAVLAGFNKRRDQNGIGSLIATLIFFGPLTAAICWFAMPMKYLIFSGILSTVMVFIYLGSSRSEKFKQVFQALTALYIVALIIAGLFIVIAQVGVWLPREKLTVGSSETGTVYVLSSDEQWTKYLDGDAHKVRIVETKDVKQRETITDSDNWRNLTPSQLWERGECDTPPNSPATQTD